MKRIILVSILFTISLIQADTGSSPTPSSEPAVRSSNTASNNPKQGDLKEKIAKLLKSPQGMYLCSALGAYGAMQLRDQSLANSNTDTYKLITSAALIPGVLAATTTLAAAGSLWIVGKIIAKRHKGKYYGYPAGMFVVAEALFLAAGLGLLVGVPMNYYAMKGLSAATSEPKGLALFGALGALAAPLLIELFSHDGKKPQWLASWLALGDRID
jgi:hypothetical protein